MLPCLPCQVFFGRCFGLEAGRHPEASCLPTECLLPSAFPLLPPLRALLLAAAIPSHAPNAKRKMFLYGLGGSSVPPSKVFRLPPPGIL